MAVADLTVRRAQPSDSDALKAFPCSTGAWYEADAQKFIRSSLAKSVAKGFTGAWVAERDGTIVAVAAADERLHPNKSGDKLTWLMVFAARSGDTAKTITVAAGLARLIKAVIADVEASDRGPFWYALVGVDNQKMRAFCEKAGFVAGPVPSNKRYLFYTARFDREPATT